MGKHREIIAKKDVGTVRAGDLVTAQDTPPASKITVDVLEELTKRAEKEFQKQLKEKLKELKGVMASPDDTLRVGIHFEVCLQPMEIK